MAIELTSYTPVNSKPYSAPVKLYPALNSELQRLLKLSIIEPSVSAYSSPAFAIEKRNGGLRLVTDFRALNAITQKDSYPFPDVWERITASGFSRTGFSRQGNFFVGKKSSAIGAEVNTLRC